MEKNIRSNLNKLLKVIMGSSQSRNILMDYFDGNITKNELARDYSVQVYHYGSGREEYVKELLEKVEGSEFRNKVYEILFYLNENFLFTVVKDKFADKHDFYLNMRDAYEVDLELAVRLELKKIADSYGYDRNDYISSKILWDIVDIAELIDTLEDAEEKFYAIMYILSTAPSKWADYIGYFEEKSLEFIEKILDSGVNTGMIENKKALMEYIKKDRLDFVEIYNNIFAYGIRENYEYPASLMRKIVYAGYNYSEAIRRAVKVLMVNDYVYNTDFDPIKPLKRGYPDKQQVEFYIKYYNSIGAPGIYAINHFLKKEPYGEKKNWLMNYIKLQLDIDESDGEKIYKPSKAGEENLDYLFDKLREAERVRLNKIYREVTGKSYKNYAVENFKERYREYLLDTINLDSIEIDKVFEYFNGNMELDQLQDQNLPSNFYNTFNSRQGSILENMEKEDFELYKKYIRYEFNKGVKKLTKLFNYNFILKNEFNVFLKYGLTEDELDFAALKMLDSYSYYKDKSLGHLKILDEKHLLKLAEENIKDFSIEGKKNFFENLLFTQEGFLLLLENIGTSKALKEMLLERCKKLESKWIQETLIERLGSKQAKDRSNAVELLINLNTDGIEAILTEHKKGEKSKKIKEMIDTHINGEVKAEESFEGYQSYLKLLTAGNKRKLARISDILIPMKDKEGNLLDIEYSQLLISLYVNYDMDKAVEFTGKLREYLSEDSIKELASRIYSWFKNNNFNSKDKEIAYFATANIGGLDIEEVKKDIEDLTKRSKGALAGNMIKVLAYNNDNSVLVFLDYAVRKIKHKQVKEGAKEALELAAKARNITPEELQDRIIPDFGLDIRGEKVYDYGSRSFRVSLLPKGQFEIFDIGRDKIVKSLPKANKADVEEMADKAREDFKILKKQVKNNYKIQVERLENALLTGRNWPKKSFEEVFINNPLMREFGVNLLWGRYEDDKLMETFRYMEDGSYNTHEEEEYELAEEAFVGLVHPIELGREEVEAWKEQLEDYEVEQPFNQIDRKIFREEKTYKMESAQSSSLNYRLLKLGWQRGEVLDGGVFYTFYLENPLVNIGAELRHEGIPVGWYEEGELNIEELSFYYLDKVDKSTFYYDGVATEAKMPFEEVSPRFYTEIINQIDNIIGRDEG